MKLKIYSMHSSQWLVTVLFMSVGWNYVSELWPPTGLLFIPQVILVSVWRLGEWYWQRKTVEVKKNLSQCHFVPYKSHIDRPSANLGLHGERPVTAHLSMAYGWPWMSLCIRYNYYHILYFVVSCNFVYVCFMRCEAIILKELRLSGSLHRTMCYGASSPHTACNPCISQLIQRSRLHWWHTEWKEVRGMPDHNLMTIFAQK
jgi:hypothetical protein